MGIPDPEKDVKDGLWCPYCNKLLGIKKQEMLVAETTLGNFVVVDDKIPEFQRKAWINDPKTVRVYIANMVSCEDGTWLKNREEIEEDVP